MRRTGLDDPEVRELLAELPWGNDPGVTPEEFVAPDGAIVVASADGAPLGMVGVRRLTSPPDGSATPLVGGPVEIGEVKRLFVRPAAQRRGVARTLLAELERTARELGYRELWLDTHDDGPAALFSAVGYEPIPAYTDHPWARHWFGKRL